MAKIIKKFKEGSIVEYDRGAFDDWCVYFTRSGQGRYAPKDTEYFSEIKNFSSKYGAENIYKDFIIIYKETNKEINDSVLKLIATLSEKYLSDSLELEILFTILYAGMVAEENKQNTKLGKRIKRLGLHQLLIENLPSENAAVNSKNKRWFELDKECKKRGF